MAKKKETEERELIPVELNLTIHETLPEPAPEQFTVKIEATLKEEPKTQQKPLWKVVALRTGSEVLKNILISNLKNDGFDVSLEKSDDQYLLVCGTYTIRQNSVNMISRLESYGYKPTIDII